MLWHFLCTCGVPWGRMSPCVFSYQKGGTVIDGKGLCSLVRHQSCAQPVGGKRWSACGPPWTSPRDSLDSSEKTVRTPLPGGTVGCFSPSLLFLWLLWLSSLSTWSHTLTISRATALWIARGKWSSLFWSLAMTNVLTLSVYFFYTFIFYVPMWSSEDNSHGINISPFTFAWVLKTKPRYLGL